MGSAHFIAVIGLISAATGSLVKTNVPQAEGAFELLILHNNDMHARFEQTSQLSGACNAADREAGKCYGGFPRVAYLVKKAREEAATGQGPPVLYLNAGDTYTGTAWFTIYKWKIAAEFVNALQPDAVALGNNELDRGSPALSPFLRSLNSTLISSNIIIGTENYKKIEKSVTFDIDNVRVGVVGYLTPESTILDSEGRVEYVDEVLAVKEEVEKLQAQGINIIIALGHADGHSEKDIEIATEVDGIDLVIAGNKNVFLWNGSTINAENPSEPLTVTQASGKVVPIINSYAYSKYLGKLALRFNAEGKLINYQVDSVLLDNSVPQDQEIISIAQKYSDELTSIDEDVIGTTAVVLDGNSCRTEECNLGNLVADAIMYHYAVRFEDERWTDAPIAIINGGAINATIDPANRPASVTRGDLLRALPIESSLVSVTVTGDILLRLLEQSVANYNPVNPDGLFLQFSGIRVVYDLAREPGSRVLSAVARCWDCFVPEFYVIDDWRSYKLLVPAAMTAEGSGYPFPENVTTEEIAYDEVTCLSEYINLRSPVYPDVAGRITLLNVDSIEIVEVAPPVAPPEVPEVEGQTDSAVASLGNHEFDEATIGVIPFIQNLTTPVLAANLLLDREPALRDEPNLRKSVILEKNGVKIGIIGYLTPETKYLAPRNNVEYEDEVPAIQREVANLQAQNVSILIALGHSGYLKDLQIAKEVNGIDLVIGGHSNTFLWNGDENKEIPEYPQGPYPTMVSQVSGRIVPVVQAYAYTKYMGKLHLKFDADGEIIHIDGQPILLDQQVPRDPEVLELVKKYQASIALINEEVIGSSLKLLDGDKCRLRECTMGNLITDAIIEYGRNHQDEINSCFNIAIVQGGRIRSSIEHPQKPFNVTRGDLLTVLPFTDTLSIVSMRGKDLLRALEHSVDTWRRVDSTGQFLQFSGMKVIYDLSKPPGFRVVSAKAVSSKCGHHELQDINDETEYKLIMPFFISDGGDGYELFRGLPTEAVTFTEVACVIEYFRKHSPINPQLTKRLVVLKEDNVYREDWNLSSKAHFLYASSMTYSILFSLLLLCKDFHR